MSKVSETNLGSLISDESAPLKISCQRKPSVVMIKIFPGLIVWLMAESEKARIMEQKIVFITEGFAKKNFANDQKVKQQLLKCYEVQIAGARGLLKIAIHFIVR